MGFMVLLGIQCFFQGDNGNHGDVGVVDFIAELER